MPVMRFGSLTVTPLSDGALVFDPAAALPAAPLEALAAHGGIEDGRWVTPLTTWAIRTAGQLVLVDTGMGPSPRPFQGHSGDLPASLSAAGIDPALVDVVLFTHLHSDHIGWNLAARDGKRAPFFPNARYIVRRPEWEHWRTSEAGFIRACVQPLADGGWLELVEDDHEPAPGVRLLSTPGHTPGHVCILVTSNGEGGIITGDAAHHPAQLEHPEWSPRFDASPEQAAGSRAALVDRLERDGLVALGGHFPAPHAGHIIRVAQRRVYRALNATPGQPFR